MIAFASEIGAAAPASVPDGVERPSILAGAFVASATVSTAATAANATTVLRRPLLLRM
jgi:hypothetical protein